MSFFPRAFTGFADTEFGPLFRMLDDYSTHVTDRRVSGHRSNAVSKFTPRFDVKETKEAYELQGELPGVDQHNIDVSFSDASTLTIKGYTAYSREEGTRPAASVENGATSGKITDGAEQDSYHKATVEDDAPTSVAEVEGKTPESEAPVAAPQDKTNQTFWLSERSTGSFQRSWTFPTRVDQDNVKASLKDGILSVVVPKAQAPATKRIDIQ